MFSLQSCVTEVEYSPDYSKRSIRVEYTKSCEKTDLCRARAADSYFSCNGQGSDRNCIYCCADENTCNDAIGKNATSDSWDTHALAQAEEVENSIMAMMQQNS